jgi:hypothetical protein
MASLEKTGLSEEHIVDQLTEGLPDSYKSHLYTARIKHTLEWLSIVSKLEADLEPKSFKSHKSSQSNHCTIAHCDESKSSSREKRFSNKPEQPRPPNKVLKKSDKPRTPCCYCLKLGNKEWHWHKDCPNKSSDAVESKSEVFQNSEAATNLVNSHSNLMTSDVDSFITIEAAIGGIRFNAILDTASTINIMPELIAKQHNLKINSKKSIKLDLAEGSTNTLGTVSFNLTIGSLTHTITAQVICDFRYHLLLGTDIGKLFPIHIDLQSREAVLNHQKSSSKAKPQQQSSHKRSQQTLAVESRGLEKRFSTHTVTRTPLTSTSNSRTALSLNAITASFSKIFATADIDLGRINTKQHRIHITNDKPIVLPTQMSMRPTDKSKSFSKKD